MFKHRKNFTDWTGHKYERLEVLNFHGRDDRGNGFWQCLCSCGNKFIVRSANLKSGTTRSCGCYQSELTSKKSKTHGMSGTSEFRAWDSMKQRCYNKKFKYYKHYGERGIIVCDRWLESFENFFKDMGVKPSKKHSLDRINNDGHYCKENCRWATKKQQSRNTRSNTVISFNNEKHSVAEWADIMGLSYNVLINRIIKKWPIEKALLTPKRQRPRNTNNERN